MTWFAQNGSAGRSINCDRELRSVDPVRFCRQDMEPQRENFSEFEDDLRCSDKTPGDNLKPKSYGESAQAQLDRRFCISPYFV